MHRVKGYCSEVAGHESSMSRTSLGSQKQGPFQRLSVRPHLHSIDSESFSRILCFISSHVRPQAQTFVPLIPNTNAKRVSRAMLDGYITDRMPWQPIFRPANCTYRGLL